MLRRTLWLAAVMAVGCGSSGGAEPAEAEPVGETATSGAEAETEASEAPVMPIVALRFLRNDEPFLTLDADGGIRTMDGTEIGVVHEDGTFVADGGVQLRLHPDGTIEGPDGAQLLVRMEGDSVLRFEAGSGTTAQAGTITLGEDGTFESTIDGGGRFTHSVEDVPPEARKTALFVGQILFLGTAEPRGGS